MEDMEKTQEDAWNELTPDLQFWHFQQAVKTVQTAIKERDEARAELDGMRKVAEDGAADIFRLLEENKRLRGLILSWSDDAEAGMLPALAFQMREAANGEKR